MSEYMLGVLDEKTWQIVCDFIRPSGERPDDGIGALPLGSLAAGVGAGAVCGAVASVPGLGLLSAAAAAVADVVGKGKGKKKKGLVSLSWEANLSEDSIYFWRIRVHRSLDMAEGEKLVVSVTDGRGQRIEKGVLELLDSRLEIAHGLSECSLADLYEHKRNVDVYLVHSDGERVKGHFVL